MKIQDNQYSQILKSTLIILKEDSNKMAFKRSLKQGGITQSYDWKNFLFPYASKSFIFRIHNSNILIYSINDLGTKSFPWKNDLCVYFSFVKVLLIIFLLGKIFETIT